MLNREKIPGGAKNKAVKEVRRQKGHFSVYLEIMQMNLFGIFRSGKNQLQ